MAYLNKRDLKIFKFKGINPKEKITLEELKTKLFEGKFVSAKNKQIINNFTLEELKDYVYFNVIEEKQFEGVAPIFTAIYKKDFQLIVNSVLNGSLNPLNILRLMFFCIENPHLYKDNKLGYYINIFKIKYETKFRRLLFKLGENRYINKLDLLNFFKELIYN